VRLTNNERNPRLDPSDPPDTINRPLTMSNDAPLAVSDAEVVALTTAAIELSRADISQRAIDTAQPPRELHQQQPGITIDLGHKGIVRLPDEVIDIIRAEIERCSRPASMLENNN
jgi:hypothetical protein